jgi:Rha family phage regulatory protein
MGNLVFVQNGQVLTDSLTVADMFDKEHKNVKRDIENVISKIGDLKNDEEAKKLGINFDTLKFERIEYLDVQNRTQTKYLLNFDAFMLVTMGYTTQRAMLVKVRYINEFNRMKEALQNQPRILSDREKLIASMKLSLETAEEVNAIKDKVAQLEQKVESQITIDLYQQQALQHQINKRVKAIFHEYESQMTEKKMFAQIHSHLRRAFAVPSYKVVRKKHFEEAMQWVKSWRPLV